MAVSQFVPPILDQWSPLSHKAPLRDNHESTSLAPTWVPKDQQRRLNAYKILAAFRANISRHFLRQAPIDRDKRREYGDAELLVSRVRAGVLGEGPELVVVGADVDLDDEPDLPPEPDEASSDGDGVLQRVARIRRERWEQRANEIVDEWERAWAELPALQERQDWLRDWAENEGFWGKVHEAEGDTIGLGDGVYTLAWSAEKQRPILRVYDPGFYFPVLDEWAADEDFPRKVHLAWEFETVTPRGETRYWLRRLTWELAPLDGGGTRSYPWNTGPSDTTCYFTDATWEVGRVDTAVGLEDLSLGNATFADTDDGGIADRLDLGLDFIPVVHVPNTPSSREHFGESSLLSVAQLLDDIHRSDTDVQSASELAAGPMVALFGAQPDTVANPKQGESPVKTTRVQPGVAFHLPKDGRMDVLDLSAGLAELRTMVDGLLDRLSVNAQVPGEVLGRVDSTQDRSGISIALSFGPFAQMVGALRMTRDAKFQLLLKFVQRIAQGGGDLEAGENPPARVAFGPYLPTDRNAVVDQVTRLLQGHAISTQSAVQFLVAAGFDVDDARGEVQRIHYENPAAAKDLADAVGSEDVAAEYLGVEMPEQPTATAQPPTPELPAVPGQPPVPQPPTGGPAEETTTEEA